MQRAWTSKGVELNGPLRVVHQYVDMPSQKVPYRNLKTGRTEIVSLLKNDFFHFTTATVRRCRAFYLYIVFGRTV